MKKIISLILAVLFILTFAGCSQPGKDGNTPYIQNGFWYVDGVNTGVKAQGEDGATPTITIDNEGYWVINGVKSEYKATGSTTGATTNINVFLPDEYDIAVNDNFQLFYRGVVQAVNPYNYDITVTCQKGNAYPRYFEWKPETADVGKSYTLTMTVRDDNGNLLKIGWLNPYGATVLTDCTFEEGYTIDLGSLVGKTVKFVNCTYGTTAITAANINTLGFVENYDASKVEF